MVPVALPELFLGVNSSSEVISKPLIFLMEPNITSSGLWSWGEHMHFVGSFRLEKSLKIESICFVRQEDTGGSKEGEQRR